MKCALLTSPNQWFVPFAERMVADNPSIKLYFDHVDILESYDAVFILSYHKIIPENFLKKQNLNLVIHASDLPEGKGWAPLFWQVLEGRDEIVFTLFKADSEVDNGEIILKKKLLLSGFELNNELRSKQASTILKICEEFLKFPDRFITTKPQIGESTFYRKRTPADSELDPDLTIREQFNLLRIVDNENFPAFFHLGGKKFTLKIEESDINL